MSAKKESGDAPGGPSKGEQDEPSLPELLAQAGILGSALEQQQAGFSAFLATQTATVPDSAVFGSGPGESSGLPDFPKIIKQLQGELAEAEGRFGALVKGLGVAIPAGAAMDQIAAALSAAAAVAANQTLAAGGLSLPLPAPEVSTGLPDFPEVIKRLEGEQLAAQKELTALFTTHGIDPADPEAGIAKLVTMPADQVPPTPSGFPGADQLATMQGGALKLEQVVSAIFAKITPR